MNTFFDTNKGDILVNAAWLAALMAANPDAGTFSSVSVGALIAAQVYNTDSQTATIVLTAADVSGAPVEVVLGLTGAITTAQNAQLPLVSALVAAIPSAVAGQTYKLRVINVGGTSSGVFTLTTNTGWTLAGAMTVAVGAWRDFIVKLTSLTAASLQSVGTGTNS